MDNQLVIKGWYRLQNYAPGGDSAYMKFTEPLYDGGRMYHVKIHCKVYPAGRELILIIDNDYDEECGRLQWADLPRIAKHWKVLDYKDISSLDAFCEAAFDYVYKDQSDYTIGVDPANPNASSLGVWTKLVDELIKNDVLSNDKWIDYKKLWER